MKKDIFGLAVFLIASLVACDLCLADHSLTPRKSEVPIGLINETRSDRSQQITYEPGRTILFDQAATYENNFVSSQLDSTIPYLARVADNFSVACTASVDSMVWWGGYWSGDAEPPDNFWLEIYPDSFDGSRHEPHNIPLYREVINYAEHYISYNYYYYEASIPAFLALPDKIYWIVIVATLIYPPQWGINVAYPPDWGDGQQGYWRCAYFGFTHWTPADSAHGHPYESGFQLYGTQVEGQPPSIPLLISPSDSSVLSDSIVTLTWHASLDNLSGVEYYTLQYCTDSTFTITDSVCIPDTFCATNFVDDLYYWRVSATDSVGNQSDWSEIWSVTIDLTTPQIDSTTVWPDTAFGGPFPIDAKVTDNIGVDSVFLYYMISGNPIWLTVVMVQGMNNWYSAEIPLTTLPDDTVSYYIYARDISLPGNENTDPVGAPANHYAFTANYTGIAEFGQIPPVLSFCLRSNPAMGEAVFILGLPEEVSITLHVYDATGRLIGTPFAGRKSAGVYEIPWSSGTSCGVYFYSLETPAQKEVGKFVFVR